MFEEKHPNPDWAFRNRRQENFRERDEERERERYRKRPPGWSPYEDPREEFYPNPGYSFNPAKRRKTGDGAEDLPKMKEFPRGGKSYPPYEPPSDLNFPQGRPPPMFPRGPYYKKDYPPPSEMPYERIRRGPPLRGDDYWPPRRDRPPYDRDYPGNLPPGPGSGGNRPPPNIPPEYGSERDFSAFPGEQPGGYLLDSRKSHPPPFRGMDRDRNWGPRDGPWRDPRNDPRDKDPRSERKRSWDREKLAPSYPPGGSPPKDSRRSPGEFSPSRRGLDHLHSPSGPGAPLSYPPGNDLSGSGGLNGSSKGGVDSPIHGSSLSNDSGTPGSGFGSHRDPMVRKGGQNHGWYSNGPPGRNPDQRKLFRDHPPSSGSDYSHLDGSPSILHAPGSSIDPSLSIAQISDPLLPSSGISNSPHLINNSKNSNNNNNNNANIHSLNPPPNQTVTASHPMKSEPLESGEVARDEDEEILPSKEEIVNTMDQLDAEIGLIEQEIDQLKKLKIDCQKPTDPAKLSEVDKILRENQVKASSNTQSLKLFQAVEVSTKTKPTHVYVPNNLLSNQMKRPVMIHHMRVNLLEHKQKIKSLVQDYIGKNKLWKKKLRAASSSATPNRVNPTRTVQMNSANQSLSISSTVQQTSSSSQRTSVSSRRSSRMLSDVVRSEEEFSQAIQQIKDQESHDPNTRYLKTICRIPDLLLGKHETQRRFINQNRRIYDCEEEFRQFKLINPWTEEEQQIFVSKYLVFPKQFGKIATFLENKSIEDVIAFYYKNKFRLDLKNLIKEYQPKRKSHRVRPIPRVKIAGTGIRREVAELQTEASQLSYWSPLTRSSRERATRSQSRAGAESPSLQSHPGGYIPGLDSDDGYSTPSSPPPHGNSRRAKTSEQSGRSLAGKSTRKSPSRGRKPPGRHKKTSGKATGERGRAGKRSGSPSHDGSLAGGPQRNQNGDLPACWTESDVQMFKKHLSRVGKDFKSISEVIGTKNQWQCQSFYYNHRKQMNLDALIPKNLTVHQDELPASTIEKLYDKPSLSSKRGRASKQSTNQSAQKSAEKSASFLDNSLLDSDSILDKDSAAISLATLANLVTAAERESVLLTSGYKASIASLLNSPGGSPEIVETSNWELDETAPEPISSFQYGSQQSTMMIHQQHSRELDEQTADDHFGVPVSHQSPIRTSPIPVLANSSVVGVDGNFYSPNPNHHNGLDVDPIASNHGPITSNQSASNSNSFPTGSAFQSVRGGIQSASNSGGGIFSPSSSLFSSPGSSDSSFSHQSTQDWKMTDTPSPPRHSDVDLILRFQPLQFSTPTLVHSPASFSSSGTSGEPFHSSNPTGNEMTSPVVQSGFHQSSSVNHQSSFSLVSNEGPLNFDDPLDPISPPNHSTSTSIHMNSNSQNTIQPSSDSSSGLYSVVSESDSSKQTNSWDIGGNESSSHLSGIQEREFSTESTTDQMVDSSEQQENQSSDNLPPSTGMNHSAVGEEDLEMADADDFSDEDSDEDLQIVNEEELSDVDMDHRTLDSIPLPDSTTTDEMTVQIPEDHSSTGNQIHDNLHHDESHQTPQNEISITEITTIVEYSSHSSFHNNNDEQSTPQVMDSMHDEESRIPDQSEITSENQPEKDSSDPTPLSSTLNSPCNFTQHTSLTTTTKTTITTDSSNFTSPLSESQQLTTQSTLLTPNDTPEISAESSSTVPDEIPIHHSPISNPDSDHSVVSPLKDSDQNVNLSSDSTSSVQDMNDLSVPIDNDSLLKLNEDINPDDGNSLLEIDDLGTIPAVNPPLDDVSVNSTADSAVPCGDGGDVGR